jgi:hypothetical protein
MEHRDIIQKALPIQKELVELIITFLFGRDVFRLITYHNGWSTCRFFVLSSCNTKKKNAIRKAKRDMKKKEYEEVWIVKMPQYYKITHNDEEKYDEFLEKMKVYFHKKNTYYLPC